MTILLYIHLLLMMLNLKQSKRTVFSPLLAIQICTVLSSPLMPYCKELPLTHHHHLLLRLREAHPRGEVCERNTCTHLQCQIHVQGCRKSSLGAGFRVKTQPDRENNHLLSSNFRYFQQDIIGCSCAPISLSHVSCSSKPWERYRAENE